MRKTFLKRRPLGEDMALQITSMADIFTILLVFLLKSCSSGAANISPAAGTQLPEGMGAEAAADALKVEIGENAILIEGAPVAKLAAFRFDRATLAPNGSSPELAKALERERQRGVLIAKSNASVTVDPKIIVVSDQRVPYATIKAVLASAALHGYTDFKLAVVRPN